MGKHPKREQRDQRCAECENSFGLLRWKHNCDVCHRTVCDECAPRKTEGGTANGTATSLRVCQRCSTTGRRLGGADAGDSAPTATIGTAPPAPYDAVERERRVRAVEERLKAQQNRGISSQGHRTGSTGALGQRGRPVLARQEFSEAAPSPLAASAAAPPTDALPTAPILVSPVIGAGNSSSPALEAALRRQQQQRAQDGSAASLRANGMSPEKVRLLLEIDALLVRYREDPPFGLRASDEMKLRNYLHFLKDKYHEPV